MGQIGRFKRFPKSPSEFEADTDYLYCPVCRIHVPCRRLETGGWEVQCAGCAGECAFCQCCLKRFCFGSRDEFPPFPGPSMGEEKS